MRKRFRINATLLVGSMLFVAIPVATATLTGACFCDGGPNNPDRCTAITGDATETRSLQIGRVPRASDAMPAPSFEPYSPGQTVNKVEGFQGSDMLVARVRIPALPEDGTNERCMNITYRRRGDGRATIEFTSRFRLVADFWLADNSVFDPTGDRGTMDLQVFVEGNAFNAAGSVEIELN